MRMIHFLAACAAAALLLGCGASAAPPPEFPEAFEPTEPIEPDSPPPAEPEEPPPPPSGVKQTGGSDADIVPDDYALMRGDCIQLGNQLAALTRSDQAVNLSPKLSAQQRAQAEKNIDRVATKIGDQYADGCEQNLVGKNVDRRSLKCAFDAKTVKDFDQCLNGPGEQK